jgi:divalent metal cation (Fe/Co/Zn/Cd) transporter
MGGANCCRPASCPWLAAGAGKWIGAAARNGSTGSPLAWRRSGLMILDPLIAIAGAVNIVVTGWKLLHETAAGLLDRSLADHEQQLLNRAGWP